MKFQKQNQNVLIVVGLCLGAIATSSNVFLHSTAHFSANAVDAVKGLLYGVGIGLLLVGLWMRARKNSTHCA